MKTQIRVIVTVRFEVERLDPDLGPVLERGFQAGRYRYLANGEKPDAVVRELADQAGAIAFERST